MRFFTTSTFRECLSNLTKKAKDGYLTVTDDICKALQSMPDTILRETNDRILQTEEFRIVKLRLPNSGQHLSKPNGFRLIYFVSQLNDVVVLLRVYPKRGPQGVVDLVNTEYQRLLEEMMKESLACSLHEVDILNAFKESNTDSNIF